MKRCFIRTIGLIITLVLLLVVVVGSAQASEVGYEQSEVAPLSTDEAEGAEDAALVCLALVGGAVLLAGGVWVRRLRRMLP